VIAVIDASVVIKWLLQDPEREASTEKATQLMELVTNGEQPVLQPTHWLVEVGAVLARESPGTAIDDIGMLTALELQTTEELHIVRRGLELAMELKQHLFDTYYHGVSLETPDCILITADEHYLHAARAEGDIASLMEWK
jgi:predicted nucleic acid-binding protein